MVICNCVGGPNCCVYKMNQNWYIPQEYVASTCPQCGAPIYTRDKINMRYTCKCRLQVSQPKKPGHPPDWWLRS